MWRQLCSEYNGACWQWSHSLLLTITVLKVCALTSSTLCCCRRRALCEDQVSTGAGSASSRPQLYTVCLHRHQLHVVVSFIQLGLSLSIESSSVSWLRYMFALHPAGQHLASATDHGGTLACRECQSDCWHVVHLLQFWTSRAHLGTRGTWASRPEVRTVAPGAATAGKHSMQSRSRWLPSVRRCRESWQPYHCRGFTFGERGC